MSCAGRDRSSARSGGVPAASTSRAIAARRRASKVLVAAVLSGAMLSCAKAGINPPLDRFDASEGYRYENVVESGGGDPETLFIVSASGGGMRAAGMFYGVMSGLARAEGGSLLEEIDVISAVSVGAVAAAYFTAFGPEAFLADFREGVLNRKFDWKLTGITFNPLNWPRFLTPSYSRSTLFGRYLDDEVFANKAYGDLRSRPLLLVHGTDLALGAEFSFSQGHFDRLCSDLDGVQLGHAVTSSMALTPWFAPVILDSYGADSCGYEAPVWVEEALEKDAQLNPTRYYSAQLWTKYGEPERHKVHLSDGSFVDSLALLPIQDALADVTGPFDFRGLWRSGKISRLVLIIIDASPSTAAVTQSFPKIPKIGDRFFTARRVERKRATETLQLLQYRLEEWREQEDDRRRASYRSVSVCNGVAIDACEAEEGEARRECQQSVAASCRRRFKVFEDDALPKLEVHTIVLRADGLIDDDLRESFDAVPPRFSLSSDQIDVSIEAGRALLESSTEFDRFLGNFRSGSR